MPSILHKTESGTDKQIVKPKTWTYVRFDGVTSFRCPTSGIYDWAVILRIEYPPTGAPNVVRGRFARYPGTNKLDETGHDDKNTTGWGGETYHSHWSHYMDMTPTMPIGFWIWHNGVRPITLDGRQIKAHG